MPIRFWTGSEIRCGIHSRALNTKERAPTQAEITSLLGRSDFRLIRSSRIANPFFGAGLLSSIPNAQIEAQAALQRDDDFAEGLGIEGRVAYLPGGFIGRLGWKAQEASTLNFIAGATVGEVGLAHNRNLVESVANGAPVPARKADLSDQGFLDLLAFNNFIAPPKPIDQNGAEVRKGRMAFETAGCAVCHAASPYTTGSSGTAPLIPTAPGFGSDADLYRRETALHNRPVAAYADLLLHDMGSFLADGMLQGAAGGAEWKTTPLWGLRLKNVYLHDGRTNDLHTAIRMHAGRDGSDEESEAYVAVQNYLGNEDEGLEGHTLNANEREALLEFLESL